MIQYKVCVVTVTYGDRWQLLNQVLTRLLTFANVAHVVVVDNASIYSVKSKVENSQITVLSNSINEGSAGGYNRGIAYATEHLDCDFIWLLDDDNMPLENALPELMKHWNNIQGTNTQKALFCRRPDRTIHTKIAMGANPSSYYLTSNNFLGFSLTNIVSNKIRKISERFKQPGEFLDKAVMPYVPYGGLMLHRQMVEKIGYPNADFFLYVDDSEYSYRITQQGAKIYLIPAALVVDIDSSQGINYKQRLFRSHLLDLWSFRTYYHVRNRMYFYSRVAVTNKLMFGINKILYLSCLWIVSIISNKRDAYNKLLSAVSDGLEGKLGKVGQEKF